jgi:uncharacterized protein involved in outer membrane biogenesis
MRWLFRWVFRLLILLVVLVVAALLLLNTIAREITERRIERATGFEVKIGRMRVGIFEPRLTIENLVIYNSADFGGSPMVDIPELHVEYNRSPIFYSNYHFKLVRLDLARLNVVEDKQGIKNLDVLEKHSKKSDEANSESSDGKTKGDKKSFRTIDTLNLSLGRATHIDLRNPGKVEELSVDVRNQILTDIDSDRKLNNILLVILISRQSMLGGEGQHWMEILGLEKKKQ